MSLYLPPADYLPHAPPMLLLEDVLNVTDDIAVCQTTVAKSGVLGPFLDAGGNLPGWYALELMAQTVGVWSGWHRCRSGQSSTRLGMVLGARELVCAAGLLPANAQLIITASLLMRDVRFGSFECAISVDNDTLATGRINTFQPATEELVTLFHQGATV